MKYRHFMPGELLVIASHDGDGLADALRDLRDLRMFRFEPESPRSKDDSMRARGVIFARNMEFKSDQPRFLSVIPFVNQGWREMPLDSDEGLATQLRLLEIAQAATARLQDDSRLKERYGVRDIVVTPNWMCGGQQNDVDGGGGPGGKPVPFPVGTGKVFRAAQADWNTKLTATCQSLQKEIEALLPKGKKTLGKYPVEVAIFDSLLPPDVILGAALPGGLGNAMLNTFFGAFRAAASGASGASAALNREDILRAATGSQRWRFFPSDLMTTLPDGSQIKMVDYLEGGMDTRYVDHDYDGVDNHGIFIMGIVQQIVGAFGENVESSITGSLYEVMNNRVKFPMDLLFTTLGDAFNNAGSSALVINLSLTFALPVDPDGLHMPSDEHPLIASALASSSMSFSAWLEFIATYIRMLDASQRDASLIGAVGNDRRQWMPDDSSPGGEVRPAARLPAAWEHVVGVAASQSNGARGVFSNRADEHDLWAFGGDVDVNNITTTSFPSLYLGKFPIGNKAAASTGMAYWAGTSFAAPIVSALMAVIRTSGVTHAEALDIVKRLNLPARFV